MHHRMLVVNALLLAAVVAAAYWRLTNVTSPRQTPPADLFMQSVAAEDGTLGWQQLCPALQAQLPREVLEQYTQQFRADHAQSGQWLSIDHIGDSPRTDGGEIRVYVATAHAPDGSTGQKTYVVQTQASGCIEAIQ